MILELLICQIFQVKKRIEKKEKRNDINVILTDTPVPQPEPLCLLKGHSKTVTDVKWSPHSSSALLASASEDNFAIVWNAIEAKHVSLFDRHRSRVLSVCWNPAKPDVLFSGGEDRFIYEWNYKDFSVTDSIECKLTTYLSFSLSLYN